MLHNNDLNRYLSMIQDDGTKISLLSHLKSDDYQFLCTRAVQSSPSALSLIKYVKLPDPLAVILHAVTHNELALQYVPERYQSEKVYYTAVTSHPLALMYVPTRAQTPKLCSIALSKNPYVKKFIRIPMTTVLNYKHDDEPSLSSKFKDLSTKYDTLLAKYNELEQQSKQNAKTDPINLCNSATMTKILNSQSYAVVLMYNCFDLDTTTLKRIVSLSEFKRSRRTMLSHIIKHYIDINLLITTMYSFGIATETVTKCFIAIGADLNMVLDKDLSRPIHYACKTLRSSVPDLIDYGVDLNIPDASGIYPVQSLLPPIYSSTGIDTFKKLIENGANPNVTYKNGDTMLHRIYEAHEYSIYDVYFNYLITCANLNITNNDGLTVLHLLCRSKCINQRTINRIKSLLQMKPDVNIMNRFGETALHLLCDNTDKISPSDSTYRIAAISLLVNNGAEINGNIISASPLHYACYNYNIPLVKHLLSLGANPNWINPDRVNHNSVPPLLTVLDKEHILRKMPDISRIELMTLLINHGANINWTDNKGQNALHHACMESNLTLVEFLLKHGTYKDQSDDLGNKPIYYAITCSPNMDIVKLLV